MCKIGDVIVIDSFKDKNDTVVPRHSFVVISNESDVIGGYAYDLISNISCSFHSEEHKRYKLSFRGNLEITADDIIGDGLNGRDGYLRADELFYFNEAKTNYRVIAHISDNCLKNLANLIMKLNRHDKIINTITNL